VAALVAAVIPLCWYEIFGVDVAIDQFDSYLVFIPIYLCLSVFAYRTSGGPLRKCWLILISGLIIFLPVIAYLLIGWTWTISGFAP
jgi:hypothetical protein